MDFRRVPAVEIAGDHERTRAAAAALGAPPTAIASGTGSEVQPLDVSAVPRDTR